MPNVLDDELEECHSVLRKEKLSSSFRAGQAWWSGSDKPSDSRLTPMSAVIMY